MKADKIPRLCIIGPFKVQNVKWVLSQGEILADSLRVRGYSVSSASFCTNRLLRLIDIAGSLLLWRGKIDIIILMVFSGRSFLTADIVSYIAKRVHKPVIFWAHGGGLPDLIRRNPVWTKRVFSRGDSIVVPSGYLEGAFKNYGCPVKTIPNILKGEDYSYRLRERVFPKIFWMRSFHTVYNPHMAIEVFERVRKALPQAVLTMAGQDRGMLKSTEKLARLKGCQDNIRFMGFLNEEDKKREFERHDIFMNTSRVDNMPVSLLEAAASGLPIVTTAVGGIPYIVEQEQTALLSADGDIAGMADAIQRLVREPDLARCLSGNGKKIAEASGWTNVKALWEGLLKSQIKT